MPGVLLAQNTQDTRTMGVYKLTLPGTPGATPLNTCRPIFHESPMGRRFGCDLDYRNSRRLTPSKTSFESLELEPVTTSTRDALPDLKSLMDFDPVLADFAPARHSTACCSVLTARRELRKKLNYHQLEPFDREGLQDTFSIGHSFRRELEIEDSIESLALWEEKEPARVQKKKIPHSWHGETTASSSRRQKPIDAVFRKKKSFFQGLISGLSFSSSRRSRRF